MPSRPRSRTENDPTITDSPATGEPVDAALVDAAQADSRASASIYERYLGPKYRYMRNANMKVFRVCHA